MYTYEEATRISTDYFNGDDLAAKVFIDKYALKNKQAELLEAGPGQMHWRLAKEFARVEAKKFKNPYNESDIFTWFDGFKYIIPQGSPMYGIGNDHQIVSISNCYLLDVPLDSYNSILDIDKQLVNISKRRGGVGIDLSNLRPKNFRTNNAAKSTTGIVSWMERYSNSIREVAQNGRRGALMLTLSIHHPDILDFITVKNNDTKVTGANISVKLTNEFLDAVKTNAEYELRFPVEGMSEYTRKVSAKEVWDKIIESAWLRAEPGLLMWDNVTRYTPADCYELFRSRGTNPCSEINLSPLDSCRLLCLNLFSFVMYPFTREAYFDYSKFRKFAKIAQRLMDDMVDLESEKIDKIIAKIDADPEPDYVKLPERQMWEKIKWFNDNGRRTGTGITALGDTLAALGIKYGSDESIVETEKIYQTLKLGCYESSVDMAEELGAFTGYSAEAEKDCPFIQRIANEDPSLYARMVKFGRRNVSLLTTAPTGTVSIVAQTTSGIEPLFRLLPYIRRKKGNPGDVNFRSDFVDQNGDHWQEFEVYHPKVKMWMEITGETDLTKSPWYGCCAEDIDWVNRVKLQAAAQKHVCHAISSTINLPEDVSKETVSKIYQTAFESGCKGMTIYRNNCRTGVLVDKKTEVKIDERPREVDCDVHHATVKGRQYFVLVGKVNDKPFEVFAGKNGILDKNIKTGKIIKKKKNFYKAEFDDDSELSPITAVMDETEEIISRFTSSLLRNNVDMNEIVSQLEKVGERTEINSFARGVARILKKYIPDNTKTGEECPECGSEIVRMEGCRTCKNCGWSKCL